MNGQKPYFSRYCPTIVPEVSYDLAATRLFTKDKSLISNQHIYQQQH